MVSLGGLIKGTIATSIVLGGFTLGALCEKNNIEYSRELTAKAIKSRSSIYHGETESSRRLIEIQKNRIENGCSGDYASMAITGIVGALASCFIASVFIPDNGYSRRNSGETSVPVGCYSDEWGNRWLDSDCSVPYPGFENQCGGWSQARLRD